MRYLILIFLFISSTGYSQQLKENINSVNNEKYTVLKNDNSIRHGKYLKTGFKNRILVEGYFKNGVKDSIWKFYNYDGTHLLTYNYKNNSIIFILNDSSLQIKKNDLLNTKNLNFEEILKNSPVRNLTELSSNYPKEALKNKVSGLVSKVAPNGKVIQYLPQTNFGYGLEDEAIKTFKSIPDFWLPIFLQSGKQQEMTFLYQCNFRADY
jgi:hypothetical protein